MNINDTVGVGKKVLEAFVLAKTGNVKRAGRLFAEAAQDENIDPLMDGLAKSIQSLEAQDEEASEEEEVEEVEEVEEDEEVEEEACVKSKAKKAKMKAEEEEEVAEEDEEEEVEGEGEGVEIPASVADVLKLEY